jgi:Fe-S cluster assembly protein SufD
MRRRIQRTVRGALEERFLVEAAGDEVRRVRIRVVHDRPGTQSRVLILVLARGRARVTLDATTVIGEAARETVAWLEIRVITQGEATVAAAPNLEIRNNLVRAGHALTTKHVTEEELFYLMSRGLTRRQAERMIVEAVKAPYKRGIIVG